LNTGQKIEEGHSVNKAFEKPKCQKIGGGGGLSAK